MTTYRITSMTAGVDLGTYEATTPSVALEMMSREAGYTSHAEACQEMAGGDELEVVAVDPCHHCEACIHTP